MAANTALSSDHALADLGNDIRQLRKVRGITLQQLALATGKSVGFLSQVERNLTRPSVAALQDISEALSVHIGWFFPEDSTGTPEEREFIVRRQNRRRLTYTELSGTEYLGLHDSLLSANLNGELALGISRYEPGASTGDDSYDHDGEEAGLVLSGTLELSIDGRQFVLDAGDSFSFKSHLRHRYVNPSPTEDTVVVWANTPITLRK
ncbi:MAG: cupin domain-containing protein [Gammaproteobacteria bacterium]|nr:cupin domain-containing protein [Gammaproteobacteria bacterium]MDH3857509.1 cupin domain-containing protein [Gammaproteobacteria bacterium]